MKNHQTPKKQTGIWMDHAEAKFINPDSTSNNFQCISSAHKSHIRTDGEKPDGTRLGNYRSTNNEAHKHNREMNEVQAYYGLVAEALQPYEEIFIFGPTDAHAELYNYLIEHKKTSGKKIKIETSDYITENQMREQVRNFFNKTSQHA